MQSLEAGMAGSCRWWADLHFYYNYFLLERIFVLKSIISFTEVLLIY